MKLRGVVHSKEHMGLMTRNQFEGEIEMWRSIGRMEVGISIEAHLNELRGIRGAAMDSENSERSVSGEV